MGWTNYRLVAERFTHIDAEFVEATSSFSREGGRVEIVVRFYAWWEHPLYLAAIERGEKGGFSSYEPGKRDVRVRAINPWAIRLQRRTEVGAWRFEQDHPLVWGFGPRRTVYANAPFDRLALIDGLMALQLPNVSEADLVNHIDLPPTEAAPLGMTLPAQLHEPVLTVLVRLGVPVFSPHPPAPGRPGTVLLLDGDDHIIADDFEIDVPEFIHEASWFRPGV